MPYWSSGRVGAVPTGQAPKQKNRKERYNRKKGITMEDLKKQTAIRLAQEQQQQGRSGATNEYGSNAGSDINRGVVPVRQASYSPVPPPPQQRGDVGYHHPHVVAQPPPPPPPPPPPAMVVPPPPPSDELYHQQHVGAARGMPAYPQHQGEHHGSALSSMSREEPPVVSTPVKRSVQKSHSYHHEHHVQRSAPRPSKSSLSDASAKSKLPHGLTVHELKEMTKARLQAEASEKQDVDSSSLGAVPSVVRASPEFRDQQHRGAPSPTAPSPIPFTRTTSRSPYPPEQSYGQQVPHDNWSTDSRNDPWENGSVSTQTSDYNIASEQSPFGVASTSFNGDDHAFNRARSLSASSGYGAHEYRDAAASPAMGQPSTSSYYDTSPAGAGAFPQNRRRAATLSPRAGLSHLHEDRPVLPGQELPGLPSFSASRPKYVAPRTRGGAFLSSPDHEANRTRTLSAVSLPAMSHTAEEFAVASDHHDTTTRISQFSAALTEDSPNTPVTGLSDVFRETPNDVSAPPGFVGGDLGGVGSVSSFGLGGVDSFEPRTRASTWGNPTPADLFGSSLFRGSECTAGLADDLASILKLSGAQEKDDDQKNSVMPPPGLM